MKSPPEYQQLVQYMEEVVDLNNLAALASWDRQTNMPPAGANARKRQLTTLRSLIHEKMTAPGLGEILDSLQKWEKKIPYESEQAATIRVARRDYQEAASIPPELIREKSVASAEGFEAWIQARQEGDFSLFLPSLRRNHAISKKIALALKPDSNPLDTRIDLREPGFTAEEIEIIFTELKNQLVRLLEQISTDYDCVDDSVLHQHYPADLQWGTTLRGVRSIGFDPDKRGRQDKSVHPFTTSFSPDDVRITTRIKEDNFAAAFFASLHEAGHGSYEQGLPCKFGRSVLGDGTSGGMHESQSRLWENLVGRSRQFWQFFYPQMRELFPRQTEGVEMNDFYLAVNKVNPSLIRVEADEVTYNLHIIIRFELEKEVYDGELDLADLPQAWNQKYHDYLGIAPESPVDGVLQDIHWSGGFGASFVSYTLGNIISVQLFEAASDEISGMKDDFTRGNFAPLLQWMQENIHNNGRKFKPKELVRRATGQTFSLDPYLSYIKNKFTDIYNL